jgi:hypothetical protein
MRFPVKPPDFRRSSTPSGWTSFLKSLRTNRPTDIRLRPVEAMIFPSALDFQSASRIVASQGRTLSGQHPLVVS